MKILLAISVVASITAASPTPTALPTPSCGPSATMPMPGPVASHVRNSHFESGDYAWLRGAFPGASATQTADWEAISNYSDHCRGAAPALVRAELSSLGENPPAGYWDQYADDVCGELTIARRTIDGFKNWTDYRRALDVALPYYESFRFAVARAEAAAPIGAGSLRDQLQAIVIPDQMLRSALSWGAGNAINAPDLDPAARTVLTKLLWRPIRDIDHRNTAWLKDIIAKNGWPTISKVGERASSNAWLLVQHSDDDPVFQLRVLRMITPLSAQGEVNRKNYALLYDRVMLPLTGKQRYGTQFTCEKRGWHPRALENEANLDNLRSQVGLDTVASYMKRMIDAYGARCPT